MSNPETALCCMIVSNPTGGERPHAWQKRVNDHMRAQAAEIARLTAERDIWRGDPAASDAWNAGCDFAMDALCKMLRVDPKDVSWDAATETLDGDVASVVGNILTAGLGDDWSDLKARAETAEAQVARLTAERDGMRQAIARLLPAAYHYGGLTDEHVSAINFAEATIRDFQMVRPSRSETAEAALRSQRAEVLREARAACDEVWADLMEKADRLYEFDDSTSLANSLSASNKASGAKLCSEALSALIDAPKEHG